MDDNFDFSFVFIVHLLSLPLQILSVSIDVGVRSIHLIPYMYIYFLLAFFFGIILYMWFASFYRRISLRKLCIFFFIFIIVRHVLAHFSGNLFVDNAYAFCLYLSMHIDEEKNRCRPFNFILGFMYLTICWVMLSPLSWAFNIINILLPIDIDAIVMWTIFLLLSLSFLFFSVYITQYMWIWDGFSNVKVRKNNVKTMRPLFTTRTYFIPLYRRT